MPASAAAIGQNGSETIYGQSGLNSTGWDTNGFGYVDSTSSHYSLSPGSNGTMVIPDAPVEISLTVTSDGQLDLGFEGGEVTGTQLYGIYGTSGGTAAYTGTTCDSVIPAGSSCTVTFTYDPTSAASCTASPYGYVYTGMTVNLDSDAPTQSDWGVRFTVTGVPVCGD